MIHFSTNTSCKRKELTSDHLLRIQLLYEKPGRVEKRTTTKITMKIKASKEFELRIIP